jgi:hypothetical protein
MVDSGVDKCGERGRVLRCACDRSGELRHGSSDRRGAAVRFESFGLIRSLVSGEEGDGGGVGRSCEVDEVVDCVDALLGGGAEHRHHLALRHRPAMGLSGILCE